MPPRRRQLLPTLLGALLPVVLVAGIWLGGHPDALPAPLRDALVQEEGRTIDAALDTIATEYYRDIPRPQLVDESLGGLVESLDDRFSQYFSPREYQHFQEATNSEFSGVGLTVEHVRRGLRIVTVFDDSPAQRVGLRPGELIVAVNGRSIADMPQGASTALIKGRPGTSVALTILRGGRRRVERVRRARVSVPVVASRIERADGVRLAHVALSTFSTGAHGELRQHVERRLRQGAKGILLDLRGNGGGLLDEAVLVASLFVPEGKIVTIRGRAQPTRVFTATGHAIDRDVPVLVLVDEGTASASEIVAGALQDRHRAKVAGTRTFGKGVFQQVHELPNGGALDITVGEYFTPSGRNLGGGGVRRGAGIHPDLAARDRPQTRVDEGLRRALRALAGEIR